MSTVDLTTSNKPKHPDTAPPKRGMLERDFRLGEYTLLERIGFGGEAEIWSAWDSHHQRVVAIKLMLNRGETPYHVDQITKEFEQQVQVLSGLAHAHVLPLYEFGQVDEYYFFAMRYCCLGSLADLLAKGPLSLDDVFYLTAQISSALAYLHDQSVVHRDLKPGNILLDSQKRVYLGDFGLAKRLALITSPLHTGRGTGAYAPFEQHALQTIMPQSDIYSLGILIYEMVTGKLPWEGMAYLAERQFKAQTELPDPREINPDLPGSLVDVLRQMTAYEWDQRPQSATSAFALLLTTLPPEKQAPFFSLHDSPARLDDPLFLAQDAQYFWHQQQGKWDPTAAAFPASLTHFALMDSAYTQTQDDHQPGAERLNQFMLRGALVHDYHISHWCTQVHDPHQRAVICEQTLTLEGSAAASRVLAQLVGEPAEAFPPGTFTTTTLEHWLNLALAARSWHMRQQAFTLLARFTPRFKRWQEVSLSPEADKNLAQLALAPSSQATQAAQLIGRIRSKLAVETIIQAQATTAVDQFWATIQTIQTTAGSLPGLVPGAIRRRVAMKRLREQLREDRDGLSWPRALIGLTVGLVLSLFLLLGLFSQPEAQLKDIYLQGYEPSGIVTIVEVNDNSLARYGRWDSWPRARHAELVDRLREAGAKTIVFDFVFDTITADDARLAAAMTQAGNVVQPVLGVGDAFHTTAGELRYEQPILPQTELLSAAAALGHTNILHDPDGYVRRLPTLIVTQGEHYPSIVLAALQVYLTTDTPITPAVDGRLNFMGRQIPVEDSGAMSIYYAGPPAEPENQTFPTVSYQDVLDGAAATDLFRDKIVLIGITATAEPDRYLTPVSKGRPMYGVEILANAIETIWSSHFIRQAHPWVNALIVIILSLLTGLVTVRPRAGLIRVILLALAYFWGATWFFDMTGSALSLFFPLLSIFLSFSVVTTYRFSLAARHHREMVQLFEARVNPTTAEATIAAVQKGEVDLGGREQVVSALLVQVQGHTQFADELGAEELLGLIRRLREFVVAAAFQYDGTIVDVRSDQVLVLFNTPLPQPDHARRAVQTAFSTRAELQKYQQSLATYHPHQHINLNYGIYTGNAIVGYTGSAARYIYTALGEAINVVAHLVNRTAPDQIVVGNTTYEKVTDLVIGVSIEPISISGIPTPIPIYLIRPIPTKNKKTEP